MKHGGVGKRKANKSVSRHVSSVIPMAKRRSSPRRSYRSQFKRKWTHKDKRIPIFPTVGFAAGLLLGRPDNIWSSPLAAMQEGNGPVAIQSAIRNLTGLAVPMAGTGYEGPIVFNLWTTINPFDFANASALKGLLWGSIASMVASKFGLNRQIKKIPIMGKYVKL